MRRTRIEQLAQEGNRAAVVARKAIEHLDSYIAPTQLGITLASLMPGYIGEPAIGHLFEDILPALLPALVRKHYAPSSIQRQLRRRSHW